MTSGPLKAGPPLLPAEAAEEVKIGGIAAIYRCGMGDWEGGWAWGIGGFGLGVLGMCATRRNGVLT